MKRGMFNHRKAVLRSTAAAAVLSAAAAFSPALADDAAPAADPSAVKFSGLIDTGLYGNDTGSNVNAGQLFTDKHDQWVLNQLMLTAEKDLDPKATGYDWGFKLQGLYGTDARYTHFIGMFDHNTSEREQFDITEANLVGHAPVLTQGGIDVKVGGYSTPIGYEVIQANLNPLYSHSYIFNYADPLKEAGVITTTHVNDTVDLWLGTDSGLQTTYGQRGNPDGGMSGIAGVGLNNLLGGKLTILALSHFGPTDAELRSDQPAGITGASHKGRYLNDVVATYKPDDLWTWVTEANYTQDDALEAHAWGIAQYGIYALSKTVSLVGRAEVFDDAEGQFVSSYQGNRDPVNAERGMTTDYPVYNRAAPRTGVTYGALTLGANIKVAEAPTMLDGTMVRPEVRYDHTLNGADGFNYNSQGIAHNQGEFSAGIDLVIPVAF